MNGAPTAHHTAAGKVKQSVTGKKGNVGGKMTPGRHGNLATALAMKNLVQPGAGTKKIADVGKIRPEGAVKIDAGNLKAASGKKPAVVAGAPKKHIGTDPKGVLPKIRIEGPIKRDAAGTVKPKASV